MARNNYGDNPRSHRMSPEEREQGYNEKTRREHEKFLRDSPNKIIERFIRRQRRELNELVIDCLQYDSPYVSRKVRTFESVMSDALQNLEERS